MPAPSNLPAPSENSLKIAMVMDAYDYSRNGVVISTRRFAHFLRERGHEVYFLTTGKSEPPYKISLPPFYVPFVRKTMQRLKTPMAWPVAEQMLPVLETVDIVHVHFPFWLGRTAINYARRLGKPTVATFHIQAENMLFNAHIHAQWAISLFYRILLNKIYNAVDLVVCPTPFSQQELLHYGLTSPSVVISNGTPPEYRPMEVDRPDKWRDHFLLLTVGRLAEEKMHRTIIEAIARSRYAARIQLVILGEGPLRETLEEAGAALPNPPLIEVLPPEALIPYYNMADLYVHAAEIEIEGMSALEAISCGLPLLASDSPRSNPRFLTLDERFRFANGDAAHLSERLDYWIERPEALRAQRQKYLRLSRQYSIDRSVEQLERAYRQLAGAAAPVG